MLVGADGRLTANGKIYTELNPNWERPRGFFDPNQQVVRRGPSDMIQTDRGERAVRTYDVGGNARVTKLGREFFRNKRTEYVVKVPVIIKGKRENGSTYERYAFLPTNTHPGDGAFLDAWDAGERFVEDGALGLVEATALIKDRILQRWQEETREGRRFRRRSGTTTGTASGW